MPSVRFATPERWLRAVTALLACCWLGYGLYRSGPGIIMAPLAGAPGLVLAVLIMRTHLTVSDEGVADHRMFHIVRVPWTRISGFAVDRPGSVWGGSCITAALREGESIGLLSTRVFSRIPSARHLDELRRVCWALDEAAMHHAE